MYLSNAFSVSDLTHTALFARPDQIGQDDPIREEVTLGSYMSPSYDSRSYSSEGISCGGSHDILRCVNTGGAGGWRDYGPIFTVMK